MWVSRFTDAPRVILRRIILLLASVMIVAMFAVAGPLAQIAHAADAAWQGNSIRYNSQVYKPESTTDPPTPLSSNDPRGMAGRVAYTWFETLANGAQRAHTIYLDGDFDRASEVSGSHISYAYSAPSSYSNPSSPGSVSIAADLASTSTGEDAPSECHGDIFGNLGWLLCGISRFLAEGVDKAYGLVRDFLEVPTVTTDTSTGLYSVWGVVRTVANISFIVAVLVIVYSQITSIGISNYGIKSMLPRIIIAAILVNVSFWLSALAVDASNVIGYSVHAVFENIRTNVPDNVEVDFSGLTVFILSAGAGVGVLAFLGAAAGSFAGLGFLLLSALLTVAFGVFVAFVILAARQAIITILVVISPLALVAYILPSTQNLFDMWRKSFTTLLVFFPLFSLLFGGSSLAGSLIMNNADGKLHIVLIGLVVQVVPLVLTPLLIRFSTGLLGKVAGLANTKSGAIDRAKGWAKSNVEYRKDKALGQEYTANPFKRMARRMDRGNRARENRREAYKANADTMARGYRDKRTGEWRDRKDWVKSDIMKRQASAQQKAAQDRGDSQYADFTAMRSDDPNAINPYSDNVFRQGKMRRAAVRATSIAPQFAKMQSEKQIINELQDSGYDIAEEISLIGTRKAMADRKFNENLARDLTANTREIQGKLLRDYGAGVMGDSGRNSILASAKATVSEADMKDAANIKASIPYDIQTDNNALSARFLGATTMTERLAYANQMADNGGPGFATLRNTIVQWETVGQGAQDLKDMKELLGTNSKIMSGGKDLETWITNDGGRRRDFATISGDVSTWQNLSASAFASMNNVSQSHALNLMQRTNQAMYDEYRNMLLNDPSSLASIKREIRAAHNLL